MFKHDKNSYYEQLLYQWQIPVCNSLSFRPSQFVPNITIALINKGIKSKDNHCSNKITYTVPTSTGDYQGKTVSLSNPLFFLGSLKNYFFEFKNHQ